MRHSTALIAAASLTAALLALGCGSGSPAPADRPKLLILDETTSALDPRTETDILRTLRRSGAGILLITHRRRTAMMCDEAVLLGHGRLLMRGEPGRVLSAFETISDQQAALRRSA